MDNLAVRGHSEDNTSDWYGDRKTVWAVKG